jgi:hypothetical protein
MTVSCRDCGCESFVCSDCAMKWLRRAELAEATLEQITGSKEPSSDYRHWYCFSFSGKIDGSVVGMDCRASTYAGYKQKNITLEMITEQKKQAGVTSSAVLMSVSYLGYMTSEEFKGEEEE